MSQRRQYKLSASMIGAFKACPMRAYLGYIEGIRPEQDTEARRIGTNWHKCLEIMGAGTLEKAWDFLDECYGTVPMGVDEAAWLKERAILASSTACYDWLYRDDTIEVVECELPFELALENPASGRALPDVRIVGKIDKIVKYDGRLYVMEHKSTSKDLGSDSTYWSRLAMDVQPSIYVIAARVLGYAVEGVLYDVWRKPQITPKLLTQADTNKFLRDGEYCGENFEVETDLVKGVIVDGEIVEFKPGAKEGTGAVRESSGMYGARLRAEIAADPLKFFARKEIPRTDADLKRCLVETVNIYQTMRILEKNNAWWRDDSQCEATFRCPYTPICYGGVDVSDGFTPENFRRINSGSDTEKISD